ncbi:sulfate ABC transporter substrate-binding protein [Luteimonas sp. FCS-9]|uniref:sulfate ABC transporter substrate-binding protein n=1 Tax=Luteimonas sp. FCS-9 TaxID=1547516 RepID=UPI00063E787A|nr:sulfate ABC transporter substrate-binding protein [Luteimonas sp. FCS-9]KLJ01024.1 sulfate transporter subunit [Luteimonas sp. FCS-9]
MSLRPPSIALLVLALASAVACGGAAAQETTLHNASFDPSREFYVDYNRAFASYWRQRTGGTVDVRMHHGGSGEQVRAIAGGLEADVATLALAADIDALAQSGLLAADWRTRLPHAGVPYTSTVVLLVRKGNPQRIHDWGDLVRPGVGVVTPDPRTSGGGRWNYLAAWAWASRELRDGAQVLDWMRRLYRNVVVADAGARAATTSFVEAGRGDVLLAWESEALRLLADPRTSQAFEIVYPSLSIRAEPQVAVIDRHVDAHGTRVAAEAYLCHLYSPTGQRLAAQHHYRPSDPRHVPASQRARFRAVPMVTVKAAFGGWPDAQRVHFAAGGLLDRVAGTAP